METTKIICTGSINAKVGNDESMKKLADAKELFAVIMLCNSDPVPMDPKELYFCERVLVMLDSKTAYIFNSVSKLKPTHKTRISFKNSFKESEEGVIEVIPGAIEAWDSKKKIKSRRNNEEKKPLFSFLRAKKKEYKEVSGPVEEKKIGEETVEESKEEATVE